MMGKLHTTFSSVKSFEFFYYFFSFYFFIISLKFVFKDLIYMKSALVQVTAWHRTRDKPLPEPMLTQSTDASMRH